MPVCVSCVSLSSVCLCGCVCVGAVFMWHLADVYVLGMRLLKDVCVWVYVSFPNMCACVYLCVYEYI